MERLNVGCGEKPLPGYVNLDGPWQERADVRFDLESCRVESLPFAGNTFDEILMVHTIEHIKELLPLMEELYRVAKPDAILGIRCPHGASDDADEDPTHVRRMFPRSFAAFGQPYYYKADYGYRGDWNCRVVKVLMREKRIQGLDDEQIATILSIERNCVTEMIAELAAVKPARSRAAPLQWPGMHIIPV